MRHPGLPLLRSLAMLVMLLGAAVASGQQLPYAIVATGQTQCYDNRQEIARPGVGQAFYGQDGQLRAGSRPSYLISPDGLTVYDQVTGLTWQRSPTLSGATPTYRDKLTYAQARQRPQQLNAAHFGGYSDWRLPTVKQLYSLILFSGTDPRPNGPDTSGLTPFIDARTFKFVYGDPSADERIIDSQWATSTLYAANACQMFGVNFADGRIKGYGLTMPGMGDKTFYVLCVRGNPQYGTNDLHDNGDGTITDRATGLTWSKADSGKGMNWEAALAWVQSQNQRRYLGHNDWRLPNAKELQSIVDYQRCPDVTSSAAIDPLFECTAIQNEIGQTDYPYYWTGTSHLSSVKGADGAVYVAFGRAAGWPMGMEQRRGAFRGGGTGGPPPGGPGGPPPAGPDGGFPPPGGPDGGPPPNALGASNYHFVDVHGAGAQRSDPKIGEARNFSHGRGPQGDVVRIANFVRLVRGG